MITSIPTLDAVFLVSVDLEGFACALQRDVEHRSTLHHTGVEHEDVGIVGRGMRDIDIVEQVEFDHFQRDACIACIGAQAANLRPGLGGGDDLVSAPGELDRRAAAKTGAGSGDQDCL